VGSRVRSFVCWTGAALAVAFCCAPAADADQLARIPEIVQDEAAAGHLPGAVVLVGKHGKIVYRRAFGARALLPSRTALTEDTIFDLASLTKVIATTPAIMQLVEQGRIALADPVAKYWPAFAANGKAGITVEQLLTHTSGLRADLDQRGKWHGTAAALAKVAAEIPVHRPGSRFLYSDINFIALGELVRRVSGEPLDTYVVRHIFQPLGMADTGFKPPAAARARIAPVDLEDGVLRWGEVQDPIARRMGGVAGHAGLFGTADDLAKFAAMLLAGGGGVLSPASVAAMTAPHTLPGGVTRGLGWDIASPYSGGQDAAFGPRSFGHTGYTGTSLWIDPASQSFLIVLASRLHPDGRGDVKPLRRHLAQLVAGTTPAPKVLPGIDVLAEEGFAPLVGKRVGLVTNQSGRNAAGARTIDVLAAAPGVRLAAIFSPEHGINGDREGKIASGVDAPTGIPVHSLYGAARRPSDDALAGLDALVVDLQDVGVRFYTYSTTMAYVLEAAGRTGLPVYVLDRPNPIGAEAVEGPVLDPALRSFTGYFPMPVRHGMTLGELAAMFNAENRIGAKLSVVRMQDYRRDAWYDQTGLSWVDPSPNIRSLKEAALYPGVALIEGANVSVGRGTPHPFELVGAPWIDGRALASHLQRRAIRGVAFEATNFTPNRDAYANQLCHGVRITLTDRSVLDTARLGIELASALARFYPETFALDHTLGMIGSRAVLARIRAGDEPQAIGASWQPELEAFRKVRSKYLLYP